MDVDNLGMWLSRGQIARWYRNRIVSLEKEIGWLEWNFVVIVVSVGVVGLNSVLESEDVSLVMCIMRRCIRC